MEFVTYEVEGAVGIITINRPKALNALNSAVLDELNQTLDAVDQNEIRCLILTGAGEKSFVAGADIGEMSTLTKAEGEAFGKKGNDVFRKLETFPIPVIAAVNGFALGGGCEISMSCDIRICSDNAVFGQPEYAQIPLAVLGIVMKFFQIVISIVVGMAAGCIPIVGYNMGAEKTMRVRELFTRLLISEALVGAVALILAEGFPHQLIAIFGASNESSYYTDFAVKAFRTYLCMMIFACVNKACFIFLQAVGKALTSTMLSMFREVVFGVGFALLLPVFFGLDGVLYSMPVSDILTFIISAVIIIKTYHELNVKGA